MMFLTEMRADPRHTPRNGSGFHPVVDLFEGAEDYTLRLELPGVDPASIELVLTNGELTIKGTKPSHTQDEGAWHLRESQGGTFERTFKFPTDVSSVEAESAFGLLTVKVAKAPQAIARKIPITVVK